jgi:hypothetical protein
VTKEKYAVYPKKETEIKRKEVEQKLKTFDELLSGFG